LLSFRGDGDHVGLNGDDQPYRVVYDDGGLDDQEVALPPASEIPLHRHVPQRAPIICVTMQATVVRIMMSLSRRFVSLTGGVSCPKFVLIGPRPTRLIQTFFKMWMSPQQPLRRRSRSPCG
jgi:hypothetical protein